MNWIESRIRAVSVKRLFACAVVLAIVVMALLSQARYITNFFKGPYEISRDELKAAQSAESLERYWVTMSADAVHETGFQEITVRKKRGVERGRSVSATYYVAEMGNRLLLVKAHGDVPAKSLKGTLKPIAGKVDLSFFNSPDMAKLRPAFYPMLLDTEDFQSDGEIGFAVAGIAALIALGVGLMAWLRFSNPKGHPAAVLAAGWAKGNLDTVATQIESQLKAPDAVKVGNHTLTKDYLVMQSLFGFKLRRTDDVIWIFKQITQKKMYYVIPTGKTFAASINFAKETLLISGKEEKVDAVLTQIATNKPWVIVGHSDEIAASYKKSRAEVVAWVAKKKSELRGTGMIS